MSQEHVDIEAKTKVAREHFAAFVDAVRELIDLGAEVTLFDPERPERTAHVNKVDGTIEVHVSRRETF